MTNEVKVLNMEVKMLTGKAKETFLKWKNVPEDYLKFTPLNWMHADLIEWLDKVGLHISVEPHLGGGAEVFFSKVFYRHPENFVDTWDDVENKGYEPKIFYFPDRQSATKAAIEQANKIYNER